MMPRDLEEMMITFFGRTRELEAILSSKDTREGVLNVYGERGIGKTELLKEAARKLEASKQNIILQINLEDLVRDVDEKQPESLDDLQRHFVELLAGQLQGRFSAPGAGSVDDVLEKIITEILILAKSFAVYLFFDTTEVLQGNEAFWSWFEARVVSPLITSPLDPARRPMQVFAGRIPINWRRPEIRRVNRIRPLEPLPREQDARNLATEELKAALQKQGVSTYEEAEFETAVQIILRYSRGHPHLIVKLAKATAASWEAKKDSAFEKMLCSETVEPYINEFLFQDISEEWKKILWWASNLDWFDATFLQEFLKKVDPKMAEGKSDFFYLQGISDLRTHYWVVWKDEDGNRLHGVFREIMRGCQQTLHPERHNRAHRAAVQVFESLARQFPDEDEKRSFLSGAEKYRSKPAHQEA